MAVVFWHEAMLFNCVRYNQMCMALSGHGVAVRDLTLLSRALVLLRSQQSCNTISSRHSFELW